MILFWVHIYLGLLALLVELNPLFLFNALVFLISVGLKSVLSEARIATPVFFSVSIYLVIFPLFLYFEPRCVFAYEMGLLNTVHCWVLILSSLMGCVF